MESDSASKVLSSPIATAQAELLKSSSAFTSPLFIASTILLGLIVIGVLFYLTSGSSTFSSRPRNIYLITGLSGSGKTSLFSVLRTKKQVSTYTSIKSNVTYFRPVSDEGEPLTENPLHIVDVPGHEKLRNLEISRIIPEIKAIVVMVDSFTASKTISQVAEMLYDLLVLKQVVEYQIPVLVVANKRDLATSVTPERLKTLLESEINTIRQTRTSAHLENLGSEGDQESDPSSEGYLGFEDKAFEFEDINNELSFLPLSLGSAIKNSPFSGNQAQIKEIISWLTTH